MQSPVQEPSQHSCAQAQCEAAPLAADGTETAAQAADHACTTAPINTSGLATPLRWALGLLAVLSLITGIIGIFVPGLPTTVFILIAGWAAARSSPRLHHWLLQHKIFGPMLENWHQGGCMSRKAKWSATATMALCAAILSLSSAPVWVIALALTCMALVLTWLWLRPLPASPT